MSTDPTTNGNRRALRIGKYEVVAHIATGGMGAVYRARDVEQDRDVALKVLTPDMAARPAMLERFRREAQSAAQLRHENIVRIFECGESNGTHFLVLEFVDGIDLHELINRKGKLPPEECRQIMIQAARALDHVHQRGIVHRDIKPSNFLVTMKDGRSLVKMTDLGLARQARDEEFRVTRDGTTVGTIDYMSPEQAKDSGKADIRSDIYSLGCTFYHMLTGQAPFPEGSLTERMYKHIEAEPEDVRTFSEKVPAGLVAILHRMMRKKPAQRYQTPKELLDDLENPDQAADPSSTETTTVKSSVPTEEARPAARDKVRRSRGKGRRSGKKARTPLFLGIPRDWRLWTAGGGMLAVLVGVALWFILAGGAQEPEPTDMAHQTDPDSPPGKDGKPSRDGKTPKDKSNKDSGEVKPPIPINSLRPLYQPQVPLDLTRLREEFKEPAFPPPAADARKFQVFRGASGQEGSFGSLEEACREENAGGKDVILEIKDNGPLFIDPLAVKGHNLVLRAAPGYRPLLVWNTHQPQRRGFFGAVIPPPSVFLGVEEGNLVLEGLDVVVQNEWRDAADEQPALVQVAGGSLAARNCTFSTSGKHPLGVAALRLLPGAAVQTAPGPTIILDHCFTRGISLAALVLKTPGSTVWINQSLLVGGEKPLLQVAAARLRPTNLHVLGSTLVAGQTLLLFEGASPTEGQPAIHWRGWDTLLAQSNPLAEGDMLVVPPEVSATEVTWKAVNCLYAGWRRFLAGKEEVSTLDAWHERWKGEEGDGTISTWPRNVPDDAEESSPLQYRVLETEAAYAATSGPGALGCDVGALLEKWPGWQQARKAWLGLAAKRFPTSPPEMLENGPAPDQEPLDLSGLDLGEEVEKLVKDLKPGDRLVLRLTGKGLRPTHPIRVKGINLVLFFEAPPKKGGKPAGAPLVLEPFQATALNQDALFEVEDGSLDIIGGWIRFPSSNVAKLPAYMFQVRGGQLRLNHCRLEGPLGEAPDSYQGLIRVVGSEKADADKTPACVVNQSVLLSGRDLFRVTGTGARVSVARSFLLAGTDAIELQPGKEAHSPLTIQLFLANNTVALRRALVHLGEAPPLTGPVEPVVIQADKNLFLAPFSDAVGQASLLHYEGETLPRGLLLWQGANNGYDVTHIQGYLVQGDSAPVPAQPLTFWTHLWGTRAGALPRSLTPKWSTTYRFPQDKFDFQPLILLLPRALRPAKGLPALGAPLAVLEMKKK